MTSTTRRLLLCGAMLALQAVAFSGNAQTFPIRPIELIVPFAPGGLIDVTARMVAEPLSRELGQAVVVRNVVGAGGNIALGQLARSRPDGHTIGLVSIGLITNSILRPGSFDPVSSFRPVGYVGTQAFVLLVNPSRFDAKDLNDALDRIRRDPGKYTYSSGGIGAPSHVLMEYLKTAQNLQVLHVPYNGQSPAITAVTAGEVDMTMQTITGAEDLIRTGRLRALAGTGESRMKMFPAVPTFTQAGIKGMEGSAWMGLASPAGLPEAQAARLTEAWSKSIANLDMQRALEARGVDVKLMDDQQFGRLIQDDKRFWERAISTGKVKLE